MKKEHVSIILPTYNRASLIKKAIDSVLEQTYPYFELIVVDDGSTDDTKKQIEEYRDSRIRYVNPGYNQGAAGARNYGIQCAQYDYIAFEDSDDVWRPSKLEKQMQVLVQSTENVGFCYHKILYHMGNHMQAILPAETVELEKKSGNIYAQLLWDNLVGCPTILAKRSCIEKTKGFDTKLKALEDYDFALQMAAHAQAVFIDEILMDARYATDGVSGNMANYLTASILILEKYKKDYLDTDTFRHRLEIILRDSERLGVEGQVVSLLEKIL
ncbi:MAG: glycosyltransferase [Lachnospiraceae bacterium]|nr:glycosyltransferase [Lachnospiraceae bacterium]